MFTDIYETKNKYAIVYADPPWRYAMYSGKDNAKSCERYYPTMNTAEIKKLPVKKIAAENSVLFLWSTAPQLPAALEILTAWGFTYKTVGFTWIKQNKKTDGIFTGMGLYTRANAEFCLLATRGKILERRSHSVKSVIISHIEQHSKKPDEARDRIVTLFGNIPRIELFARQYADGWDCWGNEV